LSQISLSFRQWGKRDPTLPFLMLHGHPGNAHCLSVLAESVQDQFWVIAPDLRGYGNSRAHHAFAMTDHLQDLETLLHQLQVDRFLVLGWSLGGILALELALRYPERVQGLVLLATAARPVGSHPPITVWDEIATGIASLINWVVPGWQWNIDTFGQRSLYRYLLQQHTPTAYQYLASAALPAYLHTSPYASQALRAALRQRYNRLADLKQIQAPALVMAGEQDRHITCSASEETARAMPAATWIAYPQTAHLFPWEIPQQVQQDLRHWVEQQGWGQQGSSQQG
jgi:proline iminopeptidase